jgi:hypothetical protein
MEEITFMSRATRLSRPALFAAAAMWLAAPAWADVTLTQTTTSKMVNGTNITRIKGHKMRIDMKPSQPGPAPDTSMIFDVDAGKIIIVDHTKKEAMIRGTADFGGALTKVTEADMETSLTPTPGTKTVAGVSCTVYNSKVAVKFAPVENQPPMTVSMAGPVCLSKTAPGQADFKEFYNAASQKGFIFSDPQAAKGQPGLAKGMATMMKKWADAGIALTSDLNMTFEGSGMMAEMMKKMGSNKTTTETTKIETTALSDDLFAVPAGYKTRQ